MGIQYPTEYLRNIMRSCVIDSTGSWYDPRNRIS